MLAETLKQATGGKVDMMESDHVRQIAMYSRRIEILPGVYPAFSDSDPTGQPETQIMAFLSRRYGWGLKDVEAKGLGLAKGVRGRCSRWACTAFPIRPRRRRPPRLRPAARAPRSLCRCRHPRLPARAGSVHALGRPSRGAQRR